MLAGKDNVDFYSLEISTTSMKNRESCKR